MKVDKKIQVLIVEDERPARRRLKRLVGAEENLEVVGQAENGQEAVKSIRRLAPDLVLLDVQMPRLSGIEVVRKVGPENMPAVIFVTAYDQYALDAFDLAALDYLLKPFDNDRFEQAINRAREMIALRGVEALRSRLAVLLQDPSSSGSSQMATSEYCKRITVKMRGQMRVIPVEKIDFISASGNYAELHVKDETYLIREQMQDLEDKLHPKQFVRIHRSYIVQIDRIESLLVKNGGRYAVKLQGGQRLKVSRSRREELENCLGIDL